MINNKQFAALLGFAFVAVWISLGFGYAILCLVGAGAFYFVASYVEGGVDVGELQARLSPGQTSARRSGSAGGVRTGARVR